MVDQGEFDGLLMALNHYDRGQEPRQEQVLPAARAKGMGVLVMKVIRPREKDPSLTPAELLRYALTLEEPHALTVGTDSLSVLEANVALLRNFQPLPAADMKRIAAAWKELDRAGTLPWVQPGYSDGAWT
jgi:aryl-alcohol dehydrogenase-like predicted oxidoreductase